MAIGSGLAASLGLAEESVYGTYTAPTRHLEFSKEDLKKIKTTVQGGGLAAGRFAQLGSRRVLTTVSGGGTVDLEVTNKGYGLIIEHLLGSSATAVQQAATTAYLQAHTIGDNIGKYLSVQKGVPDTGGTVRPYTFLGGKVTGATFQCDVLGTLMSTVEFDFKDVSEAQALAAPSYARHLRRRDSDHRGQEDRGEDRAAPSQRAVLRVGGRFARHQVRAHHERLPECVGHA
jgi:hypothetical protein